jgi:HPt (histidine-containing phosphotransfer) domain-containing protein
MTAPHALIEFFQKEAAEYLDRLEQLLATGETQGPDAAAFLSSARALRGSASMTRLEGLADFASTVERIAAGWRDRELRWDQRLHFAVRGALAELRSLVERAGAWSEGETRRSRTQSVALAAVAAGYLALAVPTDSPTMPIVPIARFFPDDGLPNIVQRNAAPPITLAQRFRQDIAGAADGVARESAALATTPAGPAQLAVFDGLRRALLGLADVAESYGASSITTLATRMARAPLATAGERAGVQGFARLLMDRELSDLQLAQQVKQAGLTWAGSAQPEPAIVPIESLLYRGHSAVSRAREVRDHLNVHRQRGTMGEPEAQELFAELSDLLDLAVTT